MLIKGLSIASGQHAGDRSTRA